ncbi:hypothetical protein DL98DRAFT_533963 [Cadophora sp. DSE1049]|nr:hypothetical protein DL98DRAFT_533963 [Cadophora sp. DSE1049]
MAMELGAASTDGNNSASPIMWVRDELSINLSAQLAAYIMLDRTLKPKKTEFRYNYFPPRSPSSCDSFDTLKKKYRRSMYNKIQLIEKTFGPEVLTHQTPQKMIARFEEDCAAVEEICKDPNGTSQIIIQARLEKLYIKFELWLDMYYDGLLNHELEARYDIGMKIRKRREENPQSYNFYFHEGKLFTFYNDPLNKKLCHEQVAISPIPLKIVWQRLLNETLRKRSDYTDKLFFFEILLKAVKHEEKRKTLQMKNSIEGLEQGFCRWMVLGELCVNIDKVAKIILRRFDVGYFFDEKREFREFLHFWAMRYCLVAEKAWEKSMADRDWAKEVGKVLYALLEFLKASHDALLEREVNAKLEETLDLIKENVLTITLISPDQKFCILRGKIHMIDKGTLNAEEKVTELMSKNKSSSELGEEEGEFKLTKREFGLPPDRILLEIEEDEDERRRQEEALMEDSDSDSESEDEMFPPLQDVIIHPVWNTKPEKGKIESRLDARRSKVLSPCLVMPLRSAAELAQPASRQEPDFPSIFRNSQQRAGTPTRTKNTPTQNAADLNTQRQQRSMAPSPGPSKHARATMMHGSSPVSSPARPATPASNDRVQTVKKQDNGSSKIILIPTLRTPAINQHNRRPANFPNQSREKSDQKKGNQMHEQGGTQQPNGRNTSGQQVCGSVSQVNAAQSPGAAQVTPDRSNPRDEVLRALDSPVKHEQIDPRERLNKWLNDPTISVTKSFSTAQRPGEPFYPPSPAIEQLLKNQKTNKNKARPAQAQAQYRTPEETYQASPAGKLAKQQVADALSTDLNINPRWPSSVLEAGVPFTDDWSSRQMPPPAGYRSWDEWSKKRSESGTLECKLADKEFENEISRDYD